MARPARCQLPMTAARLHWNAQSRHRKHRKERNHPPSHEQRNHRHAQQIHVQVLHEQQVVALPGREQEQGIGHAQREYQQRHAIVALAARTVDGTAHRDGSTREE